MKEILLLPLALVFILSACKYDAIKEASASPVSAQLKLGEASYIITPSITISLDSVLSDSRCPENANCVWAGNAEVRFIFSDNASEEKFTLKTNPGLKTETVIHGYRIQLVKLTPYPNTSIVIKQTDYQAELSIQK